MVKRLVRCCAGVAPLSGWATPAVAADHPMWESGDWTLALDGQWRSRGQIDSGNDFLGDKVLDRA